MNSMNRQLPAQRTLGTQVREAFTAPIRYFYSLLCGLAATMAVGVSTFCAKVTIKEGADMGTVVGGLIEVVIEVAFWIGVLMAVSGVVSWLIAHKDDDSNGQTRAVRLAVIGFALIGFRGLLQLAGFIA